MGRRGVTVGLPYIDRFVDRYGHERLYFRRPGGKRIALPPRTDPGFLAAYQRAADAAGKAEPKKPPVRGTPGTVARLVFDYYQSPDFLHLKVSTQGVRRRVLDAFSQEHGHRTVAGLTRDKIEVIAGKRSATPAAANNLVKVLRTLLAFAIKHRLRQDNPAAGIQRFTEGTHHTWTEGEIQQFEERWPIGTRERTAFALHLYTGQRRGDVCRMTWRDYDRTKGVISVTQEKTGVELEIAVHRDLRRALEAWPQTDVMILTTSFGKAFAVAGYGNWMADAIAKAGLPDRCVLHGLRKAAARRLADAGCTTHQIQSITGHKSLAEVQRYTVAAEQRRLARAAIDLQEQTGHKDSQHVSKFGKTKSKNLAKSTA